MLADALFKPFGVNLYHNSIMPTALGFTGQYGDAVTGLDYYGVRYYDPNVGQFISADTVQGPNRYGYVGWNPETFTDPTGHDAGCDAMCFEDIGGVVVAGLATITAPAWLPPVLAGAEVVGVAGWLSYQVAQIPMSTTVPTATSCANGICASAVPSPTSNPAPGASAAGGDVGLSAAQMASILAATSAIGASIITHLVPPTAFTTPTQPLPPLTGTTTTTVPVAGGGSITTAWGGSITTAWGGSITTDGGGITTTTGSQTTEINWPWMWFSKKSGGNHSGHRKGANDDVTTVARRFKIDPHKFGDFIEKEKGFDRIDNDDHGSWPWLIEKAQEYINLYGKGGE